MKRSSFTAFAVVLAALVAVFWSAPAGATPEQASVAAKAKPAKKKAKKKKAKAVIPSTKEIFAHVKKLTSFGYRRTGSKASLNAAKYVRKSFKQSGLTDLGFQKVGSYDWQASESGLSVGGQAVDSFPIAHAFMGGTETGTFGTGPEGIQAGVVDVKSGSDAEFASKDVDGKIVLFDLRFTPLPVGLFKAIANFYNDPDNTTKDSDMLPQPYLTNFVSTAQKAMDKGAVGVIGVLADYFDSKYYFNEEYRALKMTIPGVWVTKAKGTAIRSALITDPGTQANIVMQGSRKAAAARNVIGYLPGKSKKTLLISTHHDAVWDGAVEDASGTASVLALAKYYGSLPKKKRPMTLMFATMDSHFSGYQAHQAFTKKYVTDAPAAKRPRVNFAIEHIARHGYVGDDGKLKMTNLPEVAGILQNVGPKPLAVIEKALVKRKIKRIAVIPATFFGSSLPTDASFNYAAGVPVVSLISGPIYLYDKVDTSDKVYKPYLRPMTQAYSDMIAKMSRMEAAELPGDPPVPAGG